VLTFFDHLTAHYDWRWAGMAALICAVGVPIAFKLLADAREGAHRGRRTKALGSVVVGCLTLWTTHFVAMNGYDFGGALHFDPLLTVGSYLMALASVGTTYLISTRGKTAAWRAVAGAAGAVLFVAMAVLSLTGTHVTGQSIQLDWSIIALAATASAAVTAAGAWQNDNRNTRQVLIAGWLAAAGVLLSHLITLAAITVGPDPTAMPHPHLVSEDIVRGWVRGSVSLGIGIAGFLGGLVYWSRHSAIAQVREAIQAMPDGMGFYDAQDRLILWNARYAELNPQVGPKLVAGMTFRDILKADLAAGIHPESHGREADWIEERMKARASLSETVEQQLSDGRWLRVQDRATAEGGIVTLVNDITDLKRDAQALAEARDAAQAANTAKSQFLANMSHEIRTPLNGVIGVAQALARTDLSAQQTEMLQLIQSSGQTLQVLLSDILDLARVESGRLELTPEAFDLGRAVREAAQLFEAMAREKGLRLIVEIAPDLDGWVVGDVVRIKQILTNLVSNAVKFTARGMVTLTALPVPDGTSRPMIRFTVEDTGIGFDAETRSRLFSRFEQADGAITRRFGGSGLGLAISHQLAGMMGGTLDCESEPGGGSAFILTVPLARAQAPAAAAPMIAAATSDRHLRVLLADDHPVNRKVVQMILAQIGIELVETENGAEAVEAFRQSDFDIVLMDMQMPVMDGLLATREIRQWEAVAGLKPTPIVMLTANALSEHIQAGAAAGADRHLAKPFDAAELIQLVSTLPHRTAALAA
jgi:signal transduction histidine kinase/NO-binding membrane sensor protein with MHYT domain/ActR/RegA family two-component response regulator